jgi:hypothetical protein
VHRRSWAGAPKAARELTCTDVVVLVVAVDLVGLSGFLAGFHAKRELNSNLSGNEVYYTKSLILLVKNMLCSNFYYQEHFNLIFFSQKIVGLTVVGACSGTTRILDLVLLLGFMAGLLDSQWLVRAVESGAGAGASAVTLQCRRLISDISNDKG